MALYKRQDSAHWWVRFTAPSGREVRRSSGTTDKRQAKEYEDSLKSKLWRVENLGEKPRRLWQEAVLRFVGEQEGQPSLKDQKMHLRSLDKWLRGRYLEEIGRYLLDNVAKARKAEGVSPATVNRMLEVARAVLRRAAREWEWIDKAPAVRMLPVSQKRIRWLTHEEAEQLLAVLPGHLANMARFSLATGLRERNVTGLEWSQVDLVRKIAWIHHDQAKARKAIAVPLNTEAADIIRGQIGQHRVKVFAYRGQPVNRCNNHGWRTALRKAGIRNFRWHDLRHTWASWHVQSGTPLHALQELGGWSTYTMVLKYAHLSAVHLADHAEKIRTFSGTGRKSSGSEVA
jgi:integrase